jgi:hypothetical protein
MAVRSDPLGIDLAITTDIDPTFRMCYGEENLGNACLRRLNTEEGALADIGDDPDYGYDVRGEINSESTGVGNLARINGRVRQELLKDPRIQEMSPQVIAGGSVMTLALAGQSSVGPFAFIAAVNDMSVDYLKQGLPAGIPATQGQVVGETISVVTEIGPAGKAGEPGLPGASGSGGAGVQPDLDGLFATDSGNEDLLKEAVADFSSLAQGTLTVAFSALISALNGATGTFRLRLGGTDGVVNGAVLATVSTASGSFVVVRATATVTNPTGQVLVKLTGQSSAVNSTILVKTTVAAFNAV